MDRRRFLVHSVLSGVTLAALSGVARSAQALSLQSCEGGKDPACREIARHDELVADLGEMLTKKGVSPEERARLLASATCPFCGAPLIES